MRVIRIKRAAALLLAAAMALGLCACAGSAGRRAEPEEYTKELAYHDGFTVLQLTDLHWSTATPEGDADSGSIGYVKKVVNEAIAHAGGIDLIEITGDTLMLSNRGTVRSFIDFMTELEIPYAMLWGNHDREGKYNPNWLSRQFMKAPYCLYTEVDGDDVPGRGNYCVNLTDGDSVVWQLIELDSGASYRQGAGDMFLTYDYLRPEQFDWLERMHGAAGENVPALCYYHIAQADCDAVWEEVSAGADDYKTKFFKLEGFAASDYAPFTEDVFAENNVRGVFMGHAHAVDWTYTSPKGIVYGFGVKTGKELYYGTAVPGETDPGFDVTEEFDVIGASLVTLESPDRFSLEHLYLNEREGGDFVLWVPYE